MELTKSLDIRFEQRKRYLENPKFERLSDILTDKYTYRARRDDYMFIHLLYGHKHNSDAFPTRKIIENTFLKNYERTEINWSGIYKYYQARIESLNNNEWLEENENEIQNVVYVLEKHKNKVLKNYTTF